MAHRVLDDRLEDQVWDAHVQNFRIDANVSGEAILKTNALDFEIAVQKFKFLSQGHFHRPRIFERQPEEVAQPRDHLARAFRVFTEQRRDRVKRVEEKVRMHLHLQRFQLRLHKLSVKL